MTKTKILIDCDPGHDDALAILYAAHHLELIGLTTVFGNNSLENTTRNALAVLELGGIDVPVAAGCDTPLVQPRPAHAPVHGETGLNGADIPAPTRQPVDQHAVDFLIEQASKHRGELVLAVVGAQTNVAVALRREPRLKDWLREVTVMGGSTERGNVTPAAEFNMHCDPEAASAVFESGLPLRMVGLNVTRRTGLSDGDIARLRDSGKRVGKAAGDLMTFYLARQRERREVDVVPVHDVCAIVPYVEPELIRYARGRVDVELAGAHTRGMTVCDVEARPGTVPRTDLNANADIAVVAGSLADHLVETLLAYP